MATVETEGLPESVDVSEGTAEDVAHALPLAPTEGEKAPVRLPRPAAPLLPLPDPEEDAHGEALLDHDSFADGVASAIVAQVVGEDVALPPEAHAEDEVQALGEFAEEGVGAPELVRAPLKEALPEVVTHAVEVKVELPDAVPPPPPALLGVTVSDIVAQAALAVPIPHEDVGVTVSAPLQVAPADAVLAHELLTTALTVPHPVLLPLCPADREAETQPVAVRDTLGLPLPLPDRLLQPLPVALLPVAQALLDDEALPDPRELPLPLPLPDVLREAHTPAVPLPTPREGVGAPQLPLAALLAVETAVWDAAAEPLALRDGDAVTVPEVLGERETPPCSEPVPRALADKDAELVIVALAEPQAVSDASPVALCNDDRTGLIEVRALPLAEGEPVEVRHCVTTAEAEAVVV